MPTRPFRFLHASDFHLETPPQGVVEIPDHLREAFIEAAYSAARRVFDAALSEETEFMVLSGDILYPQQSGLRGPLFLVEQFARLAERGIAVYWAGGEVDPPDAWPSAFPLPENVHVFPQGRVAELVCERDGLPLARLVGLSHDGRGEKMGTGSERSEVPVPIFSRPLRVDDFAADPSGVCTIAVAHGDVEPAALQGSGIHYWALGGRHDRHTLVSSPTIAHYPGSPQGRRPEEAGVHGCTLVQVDERGQARTSPVPTDALRWLSERVTVDEAMGRENLESLLRERMRAIIDASPGVDLLVSWTIAGDGPLMAQLRHGALASELLAGLRTEFGFASPAPATGEKAGFFSRWSLSLDAEPVAALPAGTYEQETILGDFLRAVRQCEMNEAAPLELENYLAESHLAGSLAGAASLDAAARRRVLSEAARLGADLLGGSEEMGTGSERSHPEGARPVPVSGGHVPTSPLPEPAS